MENEQTGFSFDTVKDFDKHIEISIPNYKHIWELITSLSTYFIESNSNVYDLGCSTGLGIKLLSFKNQLPGVKFIGYDVSENLTQNIHNTKDLTILNEDITSHNLIFSNASLILSVFTIQFLPVVERKNLLERIYTSLKPGGAFIITEKILMETGTIQDIFTFSYYDFKQINFSASEIIGKQRSLRTIMKNQTQNQLMQSLTEVGFSHVVPFFQSLQFVGFLCIK